ncbi:hypothetical protein RBSWK_03133 [Rhodopirellula baltica SWK14]|uniref:Uncharacterized protein n=1 Tax=Rhodopirellula baltica SWK14 TaxID=993516 RepID=L7CG65_RHOBT|nr:hypothetical protein RBSWK_03133 [Rhodopirellula baltica SWK14]
MTTQWLDGSAHLLCHAKRSKFMRANKYVVEDISPGSWPPKVPRGDFKMKRRVSCRYDDDKRTGAINGQLLLSDH